MKAKLLAVLLAALLLLPLIAGCRSEESPGEDSQSPDVTDTSSSAGTTDAGNDPAVPERTFDDLPDADLEDRVITVLTRGEASTVLWRPIDWVCNTVDANSTEINRAVFERNKRVEERYHCTFAQVMDDNYLAMATAAYMGNTEDYDIIVMPIIHQINSMAANGYYMDLATLDNIRLDDPWWDANTNDSLSLLGRYYTLCGDVNIVDNLATWCTVFNKSIAADYGEVGDLYEAAYAGDWTLEKMYSDARLVANEDIGMWGIINEAEASYAFLASAGMFTFVKDQDGVPENNITRPSFTNVMLDIYNWMADDSIQVFGDPDIGVGWGVNYDIFAKQDSGLYLLCTLSTIIGPQFAETTSPYGILPIPKYSSEQENYVSTFQAGNATGASILVNHSDAEEIALVLSAMSAASVDTLTPAYYEYTLEQRAGQMEDPDALEMLKVIFGNRVIDIGIVMSGSARTVLTDTIKDRENFSFTSLRGQHISKMNEDLDRVIKAIQNDFKPTEESES